MKLKVMIKNAGNKISKHSPTILTALGAAGFVTTVIFSCKATIKAKEIYEKAEYEYAKDGEDLTKKEVVKLCYKYYIPSACMGVVSIGCFIAANKINIKRNAALAAAYTLSENLIKEYQDKVVETIGEKKEQEIRDNIAKDHIKNNPVEKNTVIFTGSGEVLCYDSFSGRYFKADIEKIRKTENDLNRRMLTEMYIALNEFYYEIGLPPIDIGNHVGWNVNKEGMIDLIFSSCLDDNNNPCLVLSFRVEPSYDYKELY